MLQRYPSGLVCQQPILLRPAPMLAVVFVASIHTLPCGRSPKVRIICRSNHDIWVPSTRNRLQPGASLLQAVTSARPKAFVYGCRGLLLLLASSPTFFFGTGSQLLPERLPRYEFSSGRGLK